MNRHDARDVNLSAKALVDLFYAFLPGILGPGKYFTIWEMLK